MELLVSVLSSAFWIILAIMLLVAVHELGHFLTAKWFGMRVERFSIGFPPRLVGVQRGETEYVIGATPLGGYVKISGMIDESLDTEHVESRPEPWEFRAKPVWQRIIVITAGVLFNVILAFFILSGLKLGYGETYIPAKNVGGVFVADSSLAHEMGLRTGDRILAVSGQPLDRISLVGGMRTSMTEAILADSFTVTVERNGARRTFGGPSDIMTQLNRRGGLGISFRPALVGGVADGMPADSVGLQAGDRIVVVDSTAVAFWEQMAARIQAAEGRPVRLRWHRPDSLAQGPPPAHATLVDTTAEGARVYEATVDPHYDTERGRYLVGVGGPSGQRFLAALYGAKTERYGLGDALAAGARDTWSNAVTIVVSLKRIFVGRDDLRENLGGPVKIAEVTSQAAAAGARYFWQIVAILSITLAIMNMLPIPALDGGQLVFLLYEGITRRKPSVRVRLVAQQIGMILLIGFMAFLIFNDIMRL